MSMTLSSNLALCLSFPGISGWYPVYMPIMGWNTRRLGEDEQDGTQDDSHLDTSQLDTRESPARSRIG